MKDTVVLAFVLAPLALGCDRELPPRGEALVIVDTDLPVPRIVNRLRVDLYTADRGGWYVSREITTFDPSEWPVSFSVYNPDDVEERAVVLRLRAYHAGIVRDYHGERWTPRPASGKPSEPAPIAAIPEGETPRLLDADGADITPASEPQPWVTVDRLVRITLVPGVRGSVRLSLGGACAGTMADLEGGVTCIGAANEASPIPDATLDADMRRPPVTLAGSFGAEAPCTADVRKMTTLPNGTPLFDDEVCVPGGIFIFGSASAFGRGALSDVPQRIAVLPPFRMDRNEVTVGRFRDALARGFTPAETPIVNDGPIDFSDPSIVPACTWSTLPMGREEMPVNCVFWKDAQALCQFLGGDLPSEVEWEYVAMDVGRKVKTRFPWGDAEPTCERAIYARQASLPGVFPGVTACNKLGLGAVPVGTTAGAGGDVALGTGVVNLAGNISEMTRDTFASLDSACWAAQRLDSPSCIDPATHHVSVRAGSWWGNTVALAGDVRGDLLDIISSPQVGFRCGRRLP